MKNKKSYLHHDLDKKYGKVRILVIMPNRTVFKHHKRFYDHYSTAL